MSAADPTRAVDLQEALAVSLSRMEQECFPRDRVFLSLRCGACGDRWVVAFAFEHSPYRGQAGAPLFRGLAEAIDAARALRERRDPSIELDTWTAARRCGCEGPAHLVVTERATLVRLLVGSGQALALGCQRGDPTIELHRVPHRGPLLALDEPRSVAWFFGRPLSLFDMWEQLELPEGRLDVEPGVSLWAAPDATTLVRRLAEMEAMVVVWLDRETVLSGAWPPQEELRAHLNEGVAALTIRHPELVAALRRQAISAGVDLEAEALNRLTLRRATVPWILRPHRIALEMVRFGHPLAEACAAAVEQGLHSIDNVIAFLGAMSEARPGIRFSIEHGRVTAVREDGGRGRSFPVELLPSAPDDPAFLREVAFLCDPLPEWADATRTCPCGAPSSVQARIILSEHHLLDGQDATPSPWVLRRWTNSRGEDSAIEVVVLACDRHVRIEPRALLEAAGLTEEGLRPRLREDEKHARFVVRAVAVEDSHGARAVLAQGHLAASLTTNPRWLAGLNRALGTPVRSSTAITWTFGPAGMCLFDPRFAEPERELLLAQTRAASGVASGAQPYFSLREEADIAVQPAGRFVLVEELSAGRCT